MVAAKKQTSGKSRRSFLRDSDPPATDLPDTFIDRYTEWAHTATDAPIQYHRATATIILSSIMCPYISLETSYSEIKPNIWMMMLAGTTTTRKSTSMNLALKLLNDVMDEDEYKLATDGSPEGVLQELSHRDGKVSLFHYDEITGFMQIVSREYMTGMLEGFTKLYDGASIKRVLRKEMVKIDEPNLLFMAGGIKSRMEELVGMEHVRSGFIPRFLFVTGSTTSEDMRPIGPPTHPKHSIDLTTNSPRDELLNELWTINHHYKNSGDDETVIKVAGVTKVKKSKPTHVYLDAGPSSGEVWERIRQLDKDAVKMGEHSSAPELYTPLYIRLSNAIIKVAILLAGADLSTKLEPKHLYKAIHLSQEWLDAVTDFAHAIEVAPEMDKYEKKIDKIIKWLRTSYPEPISRTAIMQKFRIRVDAMREIERTLQARNAIVITREPIANKNKGNTDGYRYFYLLTTEQYANPDSAPLSPAQRAGQTIAREDTFHAEAPGYEEARNHQRAKRRIPFPSESDEALREAQEEVHREEG